MSILAQLQERYGLGALFAGFLLVHFLWCRFVTYPSAYEKQLKRGKPWVYIPLRWKGGHKLRALVFSRILMLGIASSGAAMLIHLTGKKDPAWAAVFAVALLFSAFRLDSLWTLLRYRQQEDAYFQLHDALRTRLEREGKDYSEAQFRNLTAYQHQQRLRKADEAGKLMTALRDRPDTTGAITPSPETVET